MAIRLNKDTERYLLGSIQQFFAQQLDQEIGDLKAGQVLDFVLREIGPSVYNQAVLDAREFIQEKVSELGDVRYQPEFEFWKRG